MDKRHGIYEELRRKQKKYPKANQRSHLIHPRDYAKFLMHQVARDIGATLDVLAENQRYDDMINLVAALQSHLHTEVDPAFHTPLSTIQYRFDDEYIPTYPDLYLTHPAFITNHSSDHERCINLI